MATVDQITEVRQNTDTVNDTVEYEDTYLGGLVDQYGVNGASARVWQAKAGKYAALVDTTEGSSSRKMSQLFEQARKMTAHYYALAGEITDPSAHARVKKIVRS